MLPREDVAMRYRTKNSAAIRTTHDIAAATGTRIGAASSLFTCPRWLTHQSRKTTPMESSRQHMPTEGFSSVGCWRHHHVQPKTSPGIQLSYRDEGTSSPDPPVAI